MIKGLIHIGFEVEDIQPAIDFYEQFGFGLKKKFDKQEPQAKVAHIVNSGGEVFELWQFIDKDHPHVKFIRKHTAFESSNIEEDVQNLLNQGCELVIPITKGVTLMYAFVKDKSGNIIEIGQR